MILNAQLATQSQSCTARYCPHDSDPGSDLCTMHKRLVQAGVPIVLHVIEQPAPAEPDSELWCTSCKTWKPDDAFSLKGHNSRRGRHSECKACANHRRRRARANEDLQTTLNRRLREAAQKRAHKAADPATTARRRAKDAARRQQLRAELEAIRATRAAAQA